MTAVPLAAAATVTSGFLRRPFTVTESRITAISAAIVAAVLAGVVLGVSNEPWSFLTIASVVVLTTLLLRVQKSAGQAAVSLSWWFVIIAAGEGPAVAGIASLTAALTLTWIEERLGLRRAARLNALRDALWRLTGTIAAAIAALAAADRTERAVFQAAFNTSLEGLSLPAGILAGVLLLIGLAAVAWLLPGIAARRMSAGRTLPAAVSDALWFGAFVTAIGIGHDLRAAASTGVFSEAAGPGSWIALAASFVFAGIRIGLPSAVAAVVQPLWILVVGDRTWASLMQRHAALLAARWRNGPVTVVAAPELAPVCAGSHLRLAQMQGRLDALFPQRAVHLADWLDTLPPRERWQAVPIRELYLDPALWPQLFETQFDAGALAVVISDDEPDEGTIDRLRTVLPTSRTDFHLGVRAFGNPAARWPGVEAYRILTQGAEEIERWIAGNAKRRDEAVTRPRLMLIAHAAADAELATLLASALREQAADGTTVRADTVVLGGGRLAAVRQKARAHYWRRELLARRLRDMSQGHWYGPFLLIFVSFLMLRVGAEHDLLLIESPSLTPADLWRVVDQPVLKFATRVIAVVPPERTLLLPPSSYAGVIVRSSPDRDEQVADIVRRCLALDFDPVVPAAKPRRTAAPEQTARQPRVYLSYPKAYEGVAAELRSRLRQTCEVATGHSPFEMGTRWMSTVEQLRTSVDIIVAVIGPETIRSNWALVELEKAAAAEKPILPVVIERAALPAFIAAVPSNMDPSGTLLDLTATDEEQRRVALDQTVANIEKALERFRSF